MAIGANMFVNVCLQDARVPHGTALTHFPSVDEHSIQYTIRQLL